MGMLPFIDRAAVHGKQSRSGWKRMVPRGIAANHPGDLAWCTALVGQAMITKFHAPDIAYARVSVPFLMC